MELLPKILRKYFFHLNISILSSFFLFIFLSIYITYPLIFHMSDYISGLGDQLYINWILNWNMYSFTHNLGNILNTNIFFPYKTTLAYSDIYITMSLISFIPTIIIGQPAVAYNFGVIISYFSLGFFTYLLCLHITKNHFASIIGGVLMAFSTYTLMEIGHLQLISMGFVPLSILFFLKFLDKKSYRYYIFSCIFFIFQIYNSFLPAYFILFSCLIIFSIYLLKKKINLKDINIKKILLISLFTILVSLPVIIPYYKVSHEFSYTRDIRDSIRFANRLEYTFFPGDRTVLYKVILNTFYKNDKGPLQYDGYIGLPFFVLFFFIFVYRVIFRKEVGLLFDIFLIIALVGFVLSLGPALQWGGHVIKHPFIIPLPYAIFYYLIPGFNGLRDSSRWEMLFLFASSVCISIFLASYFTNKSKLIKYLLTFLIVIAVLLEFNNPFINYKIPIKDQFPKIYSYIKTLPNNSVFAQFPIYNWDTFPGPYPENIREYYYTLSFPKTINGTAGFDPPSWQENIRFLIKNFPNNNSLSLLKKLGVNYIIVNKDEYDQISGEKDIIDNKIFQNGKQIIGNLSINKNIKLTKIVDSSYVYKIN